MEAPQGDARRNKRRWPILGTKGPLWDFAAGASDGSPTQEGRQFTRAGETLAPAELADPAWIELARVLPAVVLRPIGPPTDLQP